jgi:3-deoxy-D-arabino-heptulosonate 7-phosphate (DAHP) synthase class II
VLAGHDALEGRLDDFLRTGRDDVKGKLVAIDQTVERSGKQADIVLQPDAFSGFDKVLAPNAAKAGIMQNQIREFSALLYEVEIGKTFDLFVEGMKTDEFAQNRT